MPLSSADWKSLIVTELKQEENTAFTSLVDMWWLAFEDKASWGPRLRYLYTKRSGVEYLIGRNHNIVSYTDADVSESLGEVRINLEQLRDDLQQEIVQIESRRRSGKIAVGAIARTAPRMPTDAESTTVFPSNNDPNDAAYKGDPIRRSQLPPYR